MIRNQNPSQEPPKSSTTPDQDFEDMGVILCSQEWLPREKLKAELDNGMLRYDDEKEKLMEHFKTDDTDRIRQFNICVVEATLDELSSKWDTIIGLYMTFVKDQDQDELLVERYKTKYKTLRKDFFAAKSKVFVAIEHQNIIKQEVKIHKKNIDDLATDQTANSIRNFRIRPNQMMAKISNNILDLVNKLVLLQPERKHKQQTTLETCLTTLSSKQKIVTVTPPPVRFYGKALLEMARIENGVLGNALDGVPELILMMTKKKFPKVLIAIATMILLSFLRLC